MRLRLPSPTKLAVLLLIGTLGIAMLVISQYQRRADKLMLNQALQSAVRLASFTESAHVQYSESVAGALYAGLDWTTTIPPNSGAIHFPATFTQLISERLADTYPGTALRVYSDDPFPTSRDRMEDEFERNAVSELTAKRSTKYWAVENSADGNKVLRVAVPIKMTAACATCHNRPEWGLKRRDWKAGDVRGVREVTMIMPKMGAFSAGERNTLFGLIAASCLLGVFVVYPAVSREVSERSRFQRLNGDLTILADTDPLTGLGNRRAFETLLDASVADWRDDRLNRGLIILDIDHFKSINDRFGHDAGDKVLADIAQIVVRQIRGRDRANRIGGEEFAVLCPDVTFRELIDIAERIRNAIAENEFQTDAGRLQVTTSIGASLIEAEDDKSSFFRRADQLLLKAKAAGRNQTAVSTEGTIPA